MLQETPVAPTGHKIMKIQSFFAIDHSSCQLDRRERSLSLSRSVQLGGLRGYGPHPLRPPFLAVLSHSRSRRWSNISYQFLPSSTLPTATATPSWDHFAMCRERDEESTAAQLNVEHICGLDVKACIPITAIEHLGFIRIYCASPNLQSDDSGDAVGATTSNSEDSSTYVAHIEKLARTSGTD
jgi:hypothetical protein